MVHSGSGTDGEPRLIGLIIGDCAIEDLVSETSTAYEIAKRLAPLRAAHGATMLWWGVNRDRVDFAVRTGADEWRVVYGSVDGERIDWLSVYQQPPVFEGVRGGQAVIVNGASGAGKSVLLQAIRQHSAAPWVVFDEPVLGAVDDGYLIWREQADVLHQGFLEGIAALARTGNLVGIAAAGHPQTMFETIFSGVPMMFVGLHCDLETLKEREHGRPGRWGGLAASSVGVHEGWRYDLEFDTQRNTTDDIALSVLRTLNEPHPH